MARYRKKPVEVQAWKISDLLEIEKTQPGRLPPPVHAAYSRGDLYFWVHSGIDIETLEGSITGSPTDWLICGIKGEFYPCKPDIFEETYEAVEE